MGEGVGGGCGVSASEYPLITIGITCFDAEDTIARAIESARRQDWGNVEIIVVDDASEDDSIPIIEEFKEKDQKISLYRHKQNSGYPSALNTIVKYARGEYIAFFDDDDESEPDRLTKQYQRLTKFQSQHSGIPVLCYSHRRVFVKGIEKFDAFVTAIGHKSPEPRGAMVADFLLWHEKTDGYVWGAFGSGTMMAAKAVLTRFPFDPNFRRSAEWDVAVRVALVEGYFIAVDEPLVIQHKTDTADKAGRKPLDYGLMLRRKHKAYLRKNHVYWGAILQTYTAFYFFRKKPFVGYIFKFFTFMNLPISVVIARILRRMKKYRM